MFQIMGKPKGGEWEDLDTADDEDERDYLIDEYRTAFGPDWTIEAKEIRVP